MLAIYLKENSNYSLHEVLELLLRIISSFKIDTLLSYLHDFSPKNETAKEIKNHLIQLTEYFVTLIAKEIIFFTRSHETLQEGFEGFLKEKMIDLEELRKAVQRIEEDPHDLTYMVSVVHKLLLSII
jgi:glutamate dehydrogenase